MLTFLTTTSMHGSMLQQTANCFPFPYEQRSSCQVSMTSEPHFVISVMNFLAVLAFLELRDVRMTLKAPRRAMCLASSRPRLTLAPVTMQVLPSQLSLGYGGVLNH